MVRPVQPSNPTGGDGKEKYTPNEKRGPSKFDEALERAKSDREKSGPGGSGSSMPKSNRDLLRNMKKAARYLVPLNGLMAALFEERQEHETKPWHGCHKPS